MPGLILNRWRTRLTILRLEIGYPIHLDQILAFLLVVPLNRKTKFERTFVEFPLAEQARNPLCS